MLSFISWQEYLLALALGSILYYAAVILMYYRKDLMSLFSGCRPSDTRPSPSILGLAKPDPHDSLSSDELEFSSGENQQEK